MQVRCIEGVAIHNAPEPCICVREDAGEASAGVRIGQPLSRESFNLGADVFPNTEGNMFGGGNASFQTTRRGLRPWHVRKLFVREPGDLLSIRGARVAGSRWEGEEP